MVADRIVDGKRCIADDEDIREALPGLPPPEQLRSMIVSSPSSRLPDVRLPDAMRYAAAVRIQRRSTFSKISRARGAKTVPVQPRASRVTVRPATTMRL
jgi:hypothetical protein